MELLKDNKVLKTLLQTVKCISLNTISLYLAYLEYANGLIHLSFSYP